MYDVLEYLASGMTAAEILSDFPDLTAEDNRACLAFAADRDNPPLYYSGRMSDHPGELRTILREMADMPPLNADIPAVSEWGFIVMLLLLLTAGTLVCIHRRWCGMADACARAKSW